MNTEAPLIYRYGRRLVVAAPTTAIVWIGDVALFALGDGTVRTIAAEADPRIIAAHRGAILCAARAPDGNGIITGGDDGRVLRVGRDGQVDELGGFGSKWVEQLSTSAASKLIVASVGKEAIVWTPGASAPSHRFAFQSTVAGLALDGKGKRLGVAHYNGASLLYAASAGSGRVELRWDGSHIACTMHPNGDYLVTGTQETGLHGWRLPVGTDMAMSGYRAKTRSFSWSNRARWLATSGDLEVVIWPFVGKTGPMGKAPLLLGAREGAIVTQVAFNLKNDLLAIGYSDGAVALGRLEDGGLLPIDEPASAITALAWNDAGSRLAWGDEDGRVGLLDMEARA